MLAVPAPCGAAGDLYDAVGSRRDAIAAAAFLSVERKRSTNRRNTLIDSAPECPESDSRIAHGVRKSACQRHFSVFGRLARRVLCCKHGHSS